MTRTLILIGTLAACGVANAGLLDINFYGTNFPGGPHLPTGAAFLGSAGDQWNTIGIGNPNGSVDTNFGPDSLFDTTGTALAAQVSFAAEGAVVCAGCAPTVDPDLMSEYLYNNSGGPVFVTLTDLAPLTNYTLVLYVSSRDAVNDRAVTGTANGVPFAATGNPATSFSPGDNMVDLSVTSDSGGSLSIVESNPGNGAGEVDLNGLQLQGSFAQTPEPGSWGLIVCGGAVLLGLKKRRG